MRAAPELFDLLRRDPDVEAPELVAVDATDRLLLDTAADLIRDCRAGEVAIVDDAYGALTLGAAALLRAGDVRVAQDLLVGERALARNAERVGVSAGYRSLPLGAGVAGARVVLVKAPKALDALGEIAEVVAAAAAPDVTMLVGARVKHMTRAMNDVLGECFTDVSATLARQKSRVLVARGPVPRPRSFPRCQSHPDLGLTVCAHGAAFAGTKVDIGTRALLRSLDRMNPLATEALDLGCGTGVLAAMLARHRPALRVLAVDQSAAAVASAVATAEANGLSDRVQVVRDDAADSVPDRSVDLVVCNPPFHVGAAVVTTAADRLFAAAARVLRPGGELWTVHTPRSGTARRCPASSVPRGWPTARRSSRSPSRRGDESIRSPPVVAPMTCRRACHRPAVPDGSAGASRRHRIQHPDRADRHSGRAVGEAPSVAYHPSVMPR